MEDSEPVGEVKMSHPQELKDFKPADEVRMSNPEMVNSGVLNSMASFAKGNTTISEERVRELGFDKFEDTFHSQMLEDIALADFRTLVSRLASRNSWIDGNKAEIISIEEEGVTDRVLMKESYDDSEDGKVIYNKLAVVKKPGDKIDLAWIDHKLNYELSPEKVVNKPDKKWYDKIYCNSSDQSITYKPRVLSEADKESLQQFLKCSASKGFLKNHSAEL